MVKINCKILFFFQNVAIIILPMQPNQHSITLRYQPKCPVKIVSKFKYHTGMKETSLLFAMLKIFKLNYNSLLKLCNSR